MKAFSLRFGCRIAVLLSLLGASFKWCTLQVAVLKRDKYIGSKEERGGGGRGCDVSAMRFLCCLLYSSERRRRKKKESARRSSSPSELELVTIFVVY